MSDFRYIGTELELFSRAIRWKHYWAQHLRPFWRGRVLEVGTGIGSNFAALGSEQVQSWVCLEPDPALARRICAPQGVPVEVVVGRLKDLPRDESFDAILYADVLEHIEDDRGELAEASARLRPGGALMVLAPAHLFLFSNFDRAIGHLRRYDRHSLRSLRPPGMELRLLRYLDSAGMILSLGNRLLLRQSQPTHSQIAFWDRFVIPISRRLDPLLGHRAGKSVISVWQKSERV